MRIEQIYTGCLAQGAYYILSENEAAIIDPLREVEPYIKRAEKDGATIKYVFETHFHADFVSGHLDLAKKTGAKIIYGPTAKPAFDAVIAKDGKIFTVGNLKIKAIHTPGHTLESTCYLLIDENNKEIALFTGDTLFIGDVGRPDLAQKISKDLTPEKLAGMLYDSLRNKVMPLSDDLIIYPAHGAGSACGKNMSKETTDTLGQQKKTNYALQNMSKEEFIKVVIDGLLPPPVYFPGNVMMNIKGYESIDTVIERGARALSPAEFEAVANESGALILDTREAQEFAKAFIPNSINIGIDGSFAPWVGALIPDIKQNILLVCDAGREEEAVTRLARVGYDNALGFLLGGIEKWKEFCGEIDAINTISATDFAAISDDKNIIDVRKPDEFSAEHILGAENVPLDYINEQFTELDKHKNYYIHCAGGYRSMIFSSILKSRGFDNIMEIQGGFKALKDTEQFKMVIGIPQI